MQDDVVLRQAADGDVEAVVQLEVAAFGASDEPGVRAHLEPPGHVEDWVVVEQRSTGRILSASVLLAHRMVFDGVEFPGGQIEYVATDPAHQRQGLVRAQFDWHHRRSAERGDLAQFITWIPYLYRRFGYGYGLDYPAIRVPDESIGTSEAAASGAAIIARVATDADRPAVIALDATRPATGLRVHRDGAAWDVIYAMSRDNIYEHLYVAERDGAVVGWWRTQHKPEDGRVYLQPSVVDPAEPASTTLAMVAHARQESGAVPLIVFDAPGTAYGEHLTALDQLGGSVRHDHGIYVRLPDPLALLERLRPVLSARLQDSRYADRTGTLHLSCYGFGIDLDYEVGEVGPVRAVAGIEDPFVDGGVGVAPDLMGALVFGRFGAVGLEERADDVTLGRHRGLMETFFPRRDADVVGDL
jgi:predicted N-acetyltransferase YhbS